MSFFLIQNIYLPFSKPIIFSFTTSIFALIDYLIGSSLFFLIKITMTANHSTHTSTFVLWIQKKGETSRFSVFVGNIPFEIEEEDLRNHFSDCGQIDNVRIIRDKKTNIGKGFGYVTFHDGRQFSAGLKKDGSILQNRALRVSPSVSNKNKKFGAFRRISEKKENSKAFEGQHAVEGQIPRLRSTKLKGSTKPKKSKNKRSSKKPK